MHFDEGQQFVGQVAMKWAWRQLVQLVRLSPFTSDVRGAVPWGTEWSIISLEDLEE